MENKKPNTTTGAKQTSNQGTAPVMRSFKDDKKDSPMKAIGIFVVLIILGIATGYALSRNPSAVPSNIQSVAGIGGPAKGKIFGSNDTTTFKDTAEGTLRDGGIDGEGQYHLERSGGDSQNVYMTSSTVDLSQFMGKKIKVWGQTQSAQKAGWLMDVGRVQVL